MTSSQLTSLNTNLVPNTLTFSSLSTDIDHINKFVLFFYKIKNNYDRYQQGLSVCPVNINWNIDINNATSSLTNIQKFSSNENIPGVLSALYYKYVLQQYYQENNSSLFSSFIFKALKEDSIRKREARNYFKDLNCCDNNNISNYNQYHFTQKQKYMGNR